MQRRTTHPLALALAAALVAAAAPAPARGADGPKVEGLRVGFTNNASPNLFKVGRWTPVWVQVHGGAERFTGVLELEVPDDDGTPTYFRQNVDIAPGESPWVVVYARPGTRDPEFTARLLNARGRVAASGNRDSLGVMVAPVPAGDTLLLTLGKPQGVEQVASLPGFATDRNGGGEVVTVARVETGAGPAPARWYGYDGAEVVVVDTNDRETVQSLGLRSQALADWVARGGHLVVAVGANWQAVRDSPLGAILPATPQSQERVPSLEALDTFAGSTKNPITPAGSPPVLVTKLEPATAAGAKVLAASGSLPLVVRGAHGFGRVTLIGVDVDQKPFATWRERPAFWLKALDLKPPVTGPEVRNAPGGRAIYQSGVSDLATQLRQALEQFPNVKLVPFGWVAFFIFLYILLIGPGDYFFLKKVVKRMELTWVTFPLIVLGVSLAAYLGAYAVKGRELRVNKVDVLDVDQASGPQPVARGTTVFNLFSPENRDYGVAVVPQPVNAPPPAAEKGGEAPRPRAGTEVLLSWMGVPETGFGAMGGSTRATFGGGYAYQPPGAFERLDGVRVPIWSTKCLTARWYGPSPALAESDLQPVGTDRLSGTVTNALDVPIKDALVVFNRHVYQLGTLAPGQTVRVELTKDRQLPGLLKAQADNYLNANNRANGQMDRADLLLAIMFHDSQSTAGGERLLTSDPLHDLDLSGQLLLERPMLVGQVDRPAARLVLDNAPVTPKVEQTTVLRVILPITRPKTTAAR